MTTNLTVLLSDSGTPNLTVSRTFQITVNEINVVPVLTLPPSQPINEEVVFSATATATDADLPANTWAFELLSGPTGLTVAPAGAISWTPTEAQGPGSYPVSVRVTDTNTAVVNEQHLSTTNSFILTVREVNRPPVLTVPTNQVLIEETTLSVSASATDPDFPPNRLTFALVSPPPGMTIDPNTDAITWTPTEAQGPGTKVIRVGVTDYSPLAVNAQQLSATNTFTVTVLESNRPPVLTVPPNQVIKELTLLSISAAATDPDVPTNTLTFALVAPPSGAAIGASSGLITWTPTEAQGSNTYTLTVTVTDTNAAAVNAKSLSVTNSFTVVVNEVNSAPSVDAMINRTVNAGQTISFTATATDADLPANALT
jgi:hypothetical protein